MGGIKRVFKNLFTSLKDEQNKGLQEEPAQADFVAGFTFYQQALEQSAKKGGEEALPLYHQAILHFRRAYEAGQDDYYTLCIWGDALKDAACFTPDSAALILWEEAADKYRQVIDQIIDLQPEDSDEYRIFANWGIALQKQARLSPNNESSNLLQQAANKYEMALQIKPEEPDILANYASALADLAAYKDISPDEAKDLLNRASYHYELSFNQDSNSADTLCDWGIVVSQQAMHANKNDARDLWRSAIGKFKQALELDPNFLPAFNGWAFALLSQATCETSNVESLLLQSMEKSRQALSLDPNNEYALDN
jgi:tetratricopeptide (TPR) repeat protein